MLLVDLSQHDLWLAYVFPTIGPRGVMAGGTTMTGTVSDGTEVDVLGEAEFLGQKYFQIRDAAKEGWVDGRFLELH